MTTISQVQQDLRKAIRVIGDQLHALATKRTEEVMKLNDMHHKVQIELQAKKELREKDSEHWQQKYNTLVREKDEMETRLDEEVCGEMKAFEGLLDEEVCVDK